MQQKKEENDTRIIEYWRGAPKFKLDNPRSWPDVPALWDLKRYQEELVPEIIRRGGLPKSSLIPGQIYLGTCRNASEALWDGTKFTYERYKFGYTYPEDIKHFEDDDGSGYDVYLPIMIKNRILDTFKRELEKMSDRGWDRIYVMIDIHDTIFKACYREPERLEWLGKSKEALQKLSEDKRFKLILWSSSYDGILEKYTEVFKENQIYFDYINVNPEVRDDDLGCFRKKPYFNILLDDKAGFEESDWEVILKEVLR
jgi:hypothetical protein